MRIFTFIVCFVSFFVFSDNIKAQHTTINWITFEQLEDSLAIKPKKVFINFYTDWCAYCKKMDEAAFKNNEVISLLNENYYAVKMDAEYKNSIQFGGKVFTNKEINKKRNPTHEIPLLLGKRKNKEFTLPLTLILDEKFNVVHRYFEYLSPKKMISILDTVD